MSLPEDEGAGAAALDGEERGGGDAPCVAPPLGRAGSKWVQEEVRGLGLAIKKNALAALLELEGGEEAVLGVLDVLQARQMTSSVITRTDVEGALLQRAAAAAAGGAGAAGPSAEAGRKVGLPRPALAYGPEEFVVLDAFEVPRVCWDFIRKAFYTDASPRSILGRPESKVHVYRNRFHMLLQRLERNRLFKRPALDLGSSRDYCELTPLQSLIGLVGVTKFVLGALNQLEDGRYFLEDTSTNVPVDLSRTQTATGMFTEGCVVVAEGALRADGVFEVFALGFPPSEPKALSLQASPGIDFFGGGAVNAEDLPGLRAVEQASDVGMLVVLSEVHLNTPATIQRLRALFSGFEEAGSVPAMFVLMGNFTSVGNDGSGISSTLVELKRGFENLARLLSEFPATRTRSRFVIVPGPGDICPSQALPRPAFVDYFAADLREAVSSVVMASSPCRVRYRSQYIVLHRDNMLEKMRRSIVVPCDGEDDVTHFQQLTATILQQSHLCPLPNNVQPTYWEYDHALAVYPMPELVRPRREARARSFGMSPTPRRADPPGRPAARSWCSETSARSSGTPSRASSRSTRARSRSTAPSSCTSRRTGTWTSRPLTSRRCER